MKDLSCKYEFTEKVENELNKEFGDDFVEKLEKIGKVANLGNLKKVELKCYTFINKYDLQEENAEIYFLFEKGKVKIFDGLEWKGDEPIREVSIYNAEDNLICEYENEELYELVTEFENILNNMGGISYLTESVITQLLKEKEIYIVDTEINLKKFNEKEKEILKKALKILKIF